MEYKPWLIFLVLALAVVAESSSLHDVTSFGLTKIGTAGSCNSEVGVCIGEDNEMLMASLHARHLAQRSKYISYGALKANAVPCGRRGHSYYNCQKRQKANPYRRGCSVITHCGRITD